MEANEQQVLLTVEEAEQVVELREDRQNRILVLLISLAVALVATVAAAVISQRRRRQEEAESLALLTPLGQLAASEYMKLTTFRKSGEAVPTPVWFAEDAGTFYLITGPTAGKIKRIRNSGRVTMTPCTLRGEPLGETVQGQAYIVQDPHEIERAEAALQNKYGLKRTLYVNGLKAARAVRRQTGEPMAYIGIEPKG